MSGEQQAQIDEPVTRTVRRRREREAEKPKRQPRYHVILWNDDDHTHEYVVVMMKQLFGYPTAKGFQIAETVDTEGRAVVLTTTKEHAELKRDQIHSFIGGPLIEDCEKGSMWATIEPEE